MALLARGLDQPRVSVAFVEDILEEGTTTTVLGAGIAVTAIVVPISISLPSSLASASSVPSGKRVRSGKVEKSRVVKKKVELDGEVLESGGEETIETAVVEKVVEETAVSTLVVTGGLVVECSVGSGGLRVGSALKSVVPAFVQKAKNHHFRGLSENSKSCDSEGFESSKLPRQWQLIRAERSSHAWHPPG